jgi:dienelactone hydrolase
MEAACLTDIDTMAKWEERRGEYREKLFDMMGLSPRPEKTELKPVVTGKVERETFSVEKLQFQSRPGLYVTGNLYLPKKLDKPAPAILYLCGHGAVKKDGVSFGNKVTYQHHGAWFAEHGYVCLIIDSLQLGEIEGIHHGTHRENMWWWISVGYTPAGVEAWNCIRALDYLETRPEVDRERMGATGRSGGGAYTWWVAALDDRIKAAAPVAGVTDLRNHVIDGVVEGHCDCMYFLNKHRWDYAQMAALVAPRPLLIANTDSDNIFPLDGVMRVHDKVKRIYKLYNAADKLGLQISPGPHKDTQELQVAVFKFFDKHLRGEERVIERAATKQLEPEELKVFAELPKDQRNTTIHETFTQSSVVTALQQDVNPQKVILAGWPISAIENLAMPRRTAEQSHNGLRILSFEIEVAPNQSLPMYVVEAQSAPRGPARLHLLNGDGWSELMRAVGGRFEQIFQQTDREKDDEAFARLKQRVSEAGGQIVLFAPRGYGPTATNPQTKARTQLRRRYMLLGETLEGMQVWDVIVAIRAARNVTKTELPVTIEASGELAAAAVYAGLSAGIDQVGEMKLTRPPKSHRAGATYMQVLRYLDMPEAVARAVLRRTTVTLLDVDPINWEITVEKVKDQEQNLTIVPSKDAQSE